VTGKSDSIFQDATFRRRQVDLNISNEIAAKMAYFLSFEIYFAR
jgi:hypothetical protein